MFSIELCSFVDSCVPRHKVPAMINIVLELSVATTRRNGRES